MISTRRRSVSEQLLTISVWSEAIRDHELSEAELKTLIIAHCFQQERNTFISNEDIMERLCIKAVQMNSNRVTNIVSKGYMEKAGWGVYNVTPAGEYLLRGLQTVITRLINGSKLSRWNKPNPGTLKHIRKPARKGAKLLGTGPQKP